MTGNELDDWTKAVHRIAAVIAAKDAEIAQAHRDLAYRDAEIDRLRMQIGAMSAGREQLPLQETIH